MKRVQVSLTEQQMNRLRRLARKRRSSMAALIREAVDQVYPDKVAMSAAWDRAQASVGGLRSDRTDVSERHDDYLADAFGE